MKQEKIGDEFKKIYQRNTTEIKLHYSWFGELETSIYSITKWPSH